VKYAQAGRSRAPPAFDIQAFLTKEPVMATTDTPMSAPVRKDKISQTNEVARAIIGAEDDARQAKTDRLRAARLKQEAKEAREAKAEAAAAPAKPAKPVAKKVRRIKV
jgi:hypothetical protein